MNCRYIAMKNYNAIILFLQVASGTFFLFTYIK